VSKGEERAGSQLYERWRGHSARREGGNLYGGSSDSTKTRKVGGEGEIKRGKRVPGGRRTAKGVERGRREQRAGERKGWWRGVERAENWRDVDGRGGEK